MSAYSKRRQGSRRQQTPETSEECLSGRALTHLILSFAPVSCLTNCAQVCKLWRALVEYLTPVPLCDLRPLVKGGQLMYLVPADESESPRSVLLKLHLKCGAPHCLEISSKDPSKSAHRDYFATRAKKLRATSKSVKRKVAPIGDEKRGEEVPIGSETPDTITAESFREKTPVHVSTSSGTILVEPSESGQHSDSSDTEFISVTVAQNASTESQPQTSLGSESKETKTTTATVTVIPETGGSSTTPVPFETSQIRTADLSCAFPTLETDTAADLIHEGIVTAVPSENEDGEEEEDGFADMIEVSKLRGIDASAKSAESGFGSAVMDDSTKRLLEKATYYKELARRQVVYLSEVLFVVAGHWTPTFESLLVDGSYEDADAREDVMSFFERKKSFSIVTKSYRSLDLVSFNECTANRIVTLLRQVLHQTSGVSQRQAIYAKANHKYVFETQAANHGFADSIHSVQFPVFVSMLRNELDKIEMNTGVKMSESMYVRSSISADKLYPKVRADGVSIDAWNRWIRAHVSEWMHSHGLLHEVRVDFGGDVGSSSVPTITAPSQAHAQKGTETNSANVSPLKYHSPGTSPDPVSKHIHSASQHLRTATGTLLLDAPLLMAAESSLTSVGSSEGSKGHHRRKSSLFDPKATPEDPSYPLFQGQLEAEPQSLTTTTSFSFDAVVTRKREDSGSVVASKKDRSESPPPPAYGCRNPTDCIVM